MGSSGGGGSFLDILKQTAPKTAAKIKPSAKTPPSSVLNAITNTGGAPVGAHPAPSANLVTPKTQQDHTLYQVPKNADAKAIQYINSANKINLQASHLDGKPVKSKNKSIWNRTFDILSRGMYATSNATLEGMAASGKSRFKGGNVLSQAEHGFAAMPHGFVQGLEGKKKTSWSDVMQRQADDELAKKQHVDPLSTSGKGKVGKLTKYGVGLGLDVALDPTSYVGAGLVPKIARGAKVTEEAAHAAEVAATKLKEPELAPLLQGGVVQKGTKVLSHENRAKAEKAAMAKIDEVAKAEGAKAAKSAARNAYRRAPLGTIVDGEKVAAASKVAQAKREQAVTNNLIEILHRNVQPETRKALQLRVAGKQVAAFKTPELLGKMNSKLLSTPPIHSSIKAFEKAFKSPSSKLDPTIHQIDLSNHGWAAQRARAHADNLNSIFNVPKATRQRVWEQIRHKTFDSPIEGGLDRRINRTTGEVAPVGNLAKHVDDEISKIRQLWDDEALSMDEINRHIPRSTTSKDNNLLLSKDFKKYGNKKGEIDPRWVHREIFNNDDKGWATKFKKDPAQALYMLRIATEKAIANKSLHQEIGHAFGVKADTATGKALQRQGYRSVHKMNTLSQDALPYHQGLLYHPDIANHIETLYDLTRDQKSATELGRVIDHANRIFKGTVTKYSPGFHTRNLLGEVMNSYLAGVKDPRAYSRAAKVLAFRNKDFMPEVNADRLTRRISNTLQSDPLTAARSISEPKHAIMRNVTKGGRKRFKDVDSDVLSGDLINSAYNANGIDTGFIASDLHQGLGHGSKVGMPFRAADRGATAVAQSIENYARMAHFIDAISKSKAASFEDAAKEAATIVRKFHFDYNDFSNFEKSTLSRAIPFYKWTRKNIPLMLEMMLAEPGKAITPYKALDELSKSLGFNTNSDSPVPHADDVMPQYLKDAGAIPVGHHGKNTVFENAALPFGQAFQFFGGGGAHGSTPRGVLGDTAMNIENMLNPFAKDPLELGTGARVGGAPISDKKKYLLSSTPYTNLGQKLSTNATDASTAGQHSGSKGNLFSDPALIQFLTGSGLAENTPKSVRATAKQMQTAASARRKDALKKKHITTVHTGVRGSKRGSGR